LAWSTGTRMPEKFYEETSSLTKPCKFTRYLCSESRRCGKQRHHWLHGT
jgi:hypothetical protein